MGLLLTLPTVNLVRNLVKELSGNVFGWSIPVSVYQTRFKENLVRNLVKELSGNVFGWSIPVSVYQTRS
jgi:outer membrane biogenesis lipoprotein LolB